MDNKNKITIPSGLLKIIEKVEEAARSIMMISSNSTIEYCVLGNNKTISRYFDTDISNVDSNGLFLRVTTKSGFLFRVIADDTRKDDELYVSPANTSAVIKVIYG